jgi:Na+/H+ antiporter NhaC
VVVALVVPVPSATAAVTSGAIFNDPTVPAKQQVIVNHLRSLIQGAATGSSIRIAICCSASPAFLSLVAFW